MADQYNVNKRGAGNVPISISGKDANAAGKYASGAELSRKAFEDQFAQSYPGASGIGGTSTRLSPAYKAALESAWNQYLASKSQVSQPNPMANMQGAAGDLSQILGLTSVMPQGPQGTLPPQASDALAAQLLKAFSQQQ